MLVPKFCQNGTHEFDRIQSAPFCTLQKSHTLESQLILEYCPKLTLKVFSLNNLERQNVDLIEQIFNEYTIQGLLTLGK